MAASSSSSSPASTVNTLHPRVFINFRGDELRDNFISHLVRALNDSKIPYFIDDKLDAGDDLENLIKEIDDSEIALAIFSERYSESDWCLNELVKIMENMKEKKLKIIPIFYRVKVANVKHFTEQFGNNLYREGRRNKSNMSKWVDALSSVPETKGLKSADYRDDSDFIVAIVLAVKKVIAKIGRERTNMSSISISSVSSNGVDIMSGTTEPPRDLPLYGIDERLRQLGEKLLVLKWEERRIIGVVGMPGIGKTILAEKCFNIWNDQLTFNKNIGRISEMSREHGSKWLEKRLLNDQRIQDLTDDKVEMFKKKIFVVLDDVSHKDQVNFLLRNRKRIMEGSKIVITTCDKSSIEELVDDIYVVPGLNYNEALQLFNNHAFKDQACSTTGNFPTLCKKFVDYAEGHPLALEELGKELCDKDESCWKARLETLPHCCNQKILTEFRISYDKLTAQQKDAFLDIACFFRSEEEDYVTCLLDPYVHESDEAVRDLAEKLLICISAGRIEMHNLLCTFGKELVSLGETDSGERMWNHDKAIDILLLEHAQRETNKVRGIFLDTSKLTKGIPLDKNIFIESFNKLNLRYLKIYDSLCPQHCQDDYTVNLPDRLNFPFEEIRYFHWLKFPLDELPPDFIPKNLIDLRLPYSKIERVWKVRKFGWFSRKAPRLKWVDLSYSTRLTDLSALSNAFHLQRLNLEGCTSLSKLPRGMENMKSLMFINLRGCVMLSSLPEKLNLISLKTLILSGCSEFSKFELNSENLEYLHLDGTAIKSLPPTIQNFQKLVILNLKDCKMLEVLPNCLDKLKALEELILSGCVRLEKFPDIKENMENLQILLLGGTSIKELPSILLHCCRFEKQVACQQPLRMNGISLLRRLCLSGNKMIRSLGPSISQLYHLKWIDLKYCENLVSISTLPPNLQCLDAHNCVLLKTVASQLALLLPTTQQVPSSFIFTNCEKLEPVAKDDIISYAHSKSRLLSEALNRHTKGFAFEPLVATCFPGSEVPAWFTHRASGAELEPELPRHWSENGFVGIALCAIVSFTNHKTRDNKLQVKCRCEFKNEGRSSSSFNFHIGGLSEIGDGERTINCSHVFIGYTNWLKISKCQEENGKKGCLPSTASIKFEAKDSSTGEVMNSEVLKCGFSLVYESASWEASSGTEYGENILFRLGRKIKSYIY